ncbi:PREDICTED: jmjC domain-containing protein 4 isoform X2 [Capra hircus]|uniref:jmjC domain-containing protein 4 isoform X2 n=1 Tax=Capra hircus TaxID=9925 RepID=UPI0008477D22|nr:PREDICTED: jmjC domain-containing protein 4 isoform X2 [Capra hircus]
MKRACAQGLARRVSGSGRNSECRLLVPLDCSGTTAGFAVCTSPVSLWPAVGCEPGTPRAFTPEAVLANTSFSSSQFEEQRRECASGIPGFRPSRVRSRGASALFPSSVPAPLSRCSFDIPRAVPRSQRPSRLPVPPRQTPSPGYPASHGRRTRPGMDRETRVFAESHFRGFEGRLPSRVCPKLDRVDFIEKPDSFSYADFFKGYLLPNLPCVFSSAFTEDWGSRRLWVTPSGKPNFDYLLQNYGDVVVPVANCGVQEYNSNPKEHMPLRDYISYWKEYIQGNYSSSRGCLYLKDWHLCRDFSAEGVFTLPIYFSSDWLNEYWDALDVDDYRFVYMGPTGTCWSVNICGRKKWFFFPPGQEEALRDCHGGLPYDVTSPTLLDSRLHPMRDRCGPPLEVTQEAGEMVFVPSGWHHQVHNLEDTISINHNWVNGCNLANMWHFLQQELSAVQQEVIEWRDTMPDWHHHCQVIMKSCSGINFEEFYHFLKIIAERRLLLLAKGMSPGQVEGGEDTGLGPQQAAFDIGRIAEVLESVVVHPDFQRVDTSTFSPQPEVLLRQLEEAVAATTCL